MNKNDDTFVDYAEKAKKTWASGDYKGVATIVPPVSAHLIKLVNIDHGDSVLDVACGYGNTAITARRKGANVTGLDITPELLQMAKEEEAVAEVSGIEWKEGNAESLPFDDESFDVVLSTFGHMFAPKQEATAKEMIRVLKKGGRIGFSTWPPEIARGRMFAAISKYAPPVKDVPPSPMLWGIPENIQKLLSGISDIYFERGITQFSTLSPNHYWVHMSNKLGPLVQIINKFEQEGNDSKERRFNHLETTF